jgi:hypothetical protein
MDRYGRNNDYGGNAHIPPPSVFISSRKAQYRNDDPSSRTQQSLQSNTPSPPTNSSSYLYPKAGKTREQLLHDIQHNIKEIDQEISSLELRPTTSHYTSFPLFLFLCTVYCDTQKCLQV